MCRKIHPDRVEEEEKHEACEKFKIIGKIKDILTNNSQNSSNSSFCVSTEHIQRANTFYKGIEYCWTNLKHIQTTNSFCIGSVREEEDIRQAYQTGKGSIKFILEVVPFVTVEDKPRIIEMVMGWISQGVVPEYERFSNESCTKRIRRQKK